MTIPDQLRAAKTQCGLSGAEIARQAGAQRQAWWRWTLPYDDPNHRDPPLSVLRRIATVTGWTFRIEPEETDEQGRA